MVQFGCNLQDKPHVFADEGKDKSRQVSRFNVSAVGFTAVPFMETRVWEKDLVSFVLNMLSLIDIFSQQIFI